MSIVRPAIRRPGGAGLSRKLHDGFSISSRALQRAPILGIGETSMLSALMDCGPLVVSPVAVMWSALEAPSAE